MNGLEQHRERLAAGAPSKVVRRRQKEGLVGQPRTGRIADMSGEVGGERHVPLVPAGHIIEHRFEPVRRIVAVEPRDNLAALVEEEKRGGELHVESPRQRFFAHRAPIDPGRLPVAPEVERDRDKMPAGFLDDAALGKIGRHERLTVRATVLAEIDHEPAMVARRVADIVAKVEERLGEPRRDVDGVRRGVLRRRRALDRRAAKRDGEEPAPQRIPCAQERESFRAEGGPCGHHTMGLAETVAVSSLCSKAKHRRASTDSGARGSA